MPDFLYCGYPCSKCVYNKLRQNQQPCFDCLRAKDFPNFEEEVEEDESNNSGNG